MTDEALEAHESRIETDKAKAVAFDAVLARAISLGFPSITAALDALESKLEDR